MRDIDARSLNEWLDARNGWLLLDVMPRAAFELEHIPGSESVPVDLDDFESRVEQLAESRHMPVIVYADREDTGTSELAAERLEQHGFEAVVHFAGGLDAWRRAGFPVIAEGEDSSLLFPHHERRSG